MVRSHVVVHSGDRSCCIRGSELAVAESDVLGFSANPCCPSSRLQGRGTVPSRGFQADEFPASCVRPPAVWSRGRDLRGLPLIERKKRLPGLFQRKRELCARHSQLT